MKRIAAHIGLTAFCVLAVAFYLSETLNFALMLTMAALAILFLLIKKARKTVALPLMAIVAALSFGVNLAYTALAVKPVTNRFCGENKRIEATLSDEAYRQYSKYYYRLKTDSIDGEEANVNILLKTNSPLEIEPFDTISFSADISPTENDYYRSKGYYVTVDALGVSFQITEAESRPLYYRIIELRRSMRAAIEEFLPEREASLCEAILIGDKYKLDTAVKNDFRICGASYFIVVSGMHFSVLVCLSMWLLKKLLRKRYLYYPLTYLVIFLYMFVTGLQPSVVRSGIMMLILVTGRWALRQGDPLTSLGVAGFIMPFIFSPYGCGDIGMILSFAATFSIIVWQSPIYEKISIKNPGGNIIKRGINAVLAIVSVSLAANILVLPLSVFLFNGFSLLTLLSALLLYPLIWLIMVFALFVCVFCYLGPLKYLALLLSWPLYGVAKLTLWLVDSLSEIPYAYIHVRSLYFYIWVAVTLVLGLLAYCLRKRCWLYPVVLWVSAFLFFGGMTVNTIVQLNVNQLNYIAGEQGATVYLNRSGRIHLLRFDCDSSSAYQMLLQLTDDYGCAESAVCTNYTERVNYNRLSDKEFSVNHYLLYQNVSEVYNGNEPELSFAGDSVFILDDDVVLRTVEHDRKMLLYLMDGNKSLLMIPTGFSYDAIPADMRYADVMIVNKYIEDYDKLSCDTLCFVNTSASKTALPPPQYETIDKASGKHLIFDMN